MSDSDRSLFSFPQRWSTHIYAHWPQTGLRQNQEGFHGSVYVVELVGNTEMYSNISIFVNVCACIVYVHACVHVRVQFSIRVPSRYWNNGGSRFFLYESAPLHAISNPSWSKVTITFRSSVDLAIQISSPPNLILIGLQAASSKH